MSNRHNFLALSMLLLLSAGCKKNYTPKPTGYVKVDYPEKTYIKFDSTAPFTFEYPAYAEVEPVETAKREPYWYNVNFPMYKGTLHLSYKNIRGDVEPFIKDSRDLVYKHASQADGIVEVPFRDTAGHRYGILYELGGDVASSVQFFLTDSTRHFLRGSLYFRTTPNRDSLNPIINFVKEDIEHMIETVQWK